MVKLPEGRQRGGSTLGSSALSSLTVVASLCAGAGATTLAACSRTGLLFGGFEFLGPDAGLTLPDGALELAPDGSALELDAGPDANPDASDATVNYSIVLFGGEESDAAVPTDTWTFFEGKWTLKDPPPPPPRGRYKHSMAPWQGKVLLYGGLANSQARDQLTETWQWDGESWTQLSSDGPESNTNPIAMADLNGVVVAYILNTMDGASTWVWDGSWSLVTTGGPPKASEAVMTRVGDQIIWVGAGETWAWDGAVWKQLSAPGPVGVPVTAPSYIAGLESTAVFFIPPQSPATLDGVKFGGTAVFDGTGWTALNVTGPGPREDPATAGTPNQAILFGGAVPGSTGTLPFGDTWAWDGGTWTQLDAAGPEPRSGTAMSIFPVPGMH